VTSPIDILHGFIATFISAWPQADASTLGVYFSEDAVYHNIPMEPVRGREAIVTTFAAFMEMGGQVRVDIVNLVADGAIVMTERIDHFIGSDRTISLPLMGIVEIHDGAITAWRDYFDLNQFTSLLAEGE
jgi:limonene-1,2-epoxide hydrolase